MQEFTTFLYVLFAALLFCGIGLTNYSAIMVRRTDNVYKFGAYLSIGNVGYLLAPIATVFAAVAGIIVAHESGYSLTAGWLVAAYVAAGILVVVPTLTVRRWGIAAQGLMPMALSNDRILGEQKDLILCHWRTRVDVLTNGLLLFVLFDMTVRPGA